MARQGQTDVYQTHVEPHLEEIKEWYQTMTLQQLAKKLGISKGTLCKYRNEHPELDKAMTIGRDKLVEELRASIKKRAKGYEWVEVTQEKALNPDTGRMEVVKEKHVTKHVPADLGSAHLLLKNLDPTWHDADKTTIKQREKEIKIKQQKADAAEW